MIYRGYEITFNEDTGEFVVKHPKGTIVGYRQTEAQALALVDEIKWLDRNTTYKGAR